MNTFLPFSRLDLSAKALDTKRLNKQISEARQIARALLGETNGYKSHPATLMWSGHVEALLEYAMWCCDAFLLIRKKRHKYETWIQETKKKVAATRAYNEKRTLPWWLGHPKFHEANRKILLWKDPAWYKKSLRATPARTPSTKPEYVWPVSRDRWKIENGKLFVLKSKWKLVKCKVDMDTGFTSRILVGSNVARYLLQI